MASTGGAQQYRFSTGSNAVKSLKKIKRFISPYPRRELPTSNDNGIIISGNERFETFI
jgi:hypothetical protein